MFIPFRKKHLLTIFESYDPDKGALDKYLHLYFKSHKSLGSKDRAYLAETVYGLTRWKRLIQTLVDKNASWENKINKFEEIKPLLNKPLKHFPDLSPAVALSFPDELYSLLEESLGVESVNTYCLKSNTPAPTTIRANPLKTTRRDLVKALKRHGIECEATALSPQGIKLSKRSSLFQLPEFKEGHFEMQDEGSQLLAGLVDADPKSHVLDFCAGSGGKTLAFAHKLQGTGQIYLSDIRQHALLEAKKRLKRAGIENAQFLDPSKGKLKRLKGNMDWTLVDAPCSGTGTYRRNPDMKWRFSKEMLDRLVLEQREILSEAVKTLKPKGTLVYGTCSVLKEENENQVQWIEENLGLKLAFPPLKTSPENEEMDGFFGAVFVNSKL